MATVPFGIETISAEPAEVQFVVGLPREEFRAALRGSGKDFSNLCRLNGLRLNRFDDGKNIHVGIERAKNATAAQRAAEAQALTEIARHFGSATKQGSQERIQQAASRAAEVIARGGEWRDFAVSDVKMLEMEHSIPGFTAVAIMPSKCTFAEESPAELRRQTGLAERDFVRFPAYHGLAVHSYESYRPKIAQEKPLQSKRPVNQKPRE